MPSSPHFSLCFSFVCYTIHTYILVQQMQQIGKKKCTLPSELSQLIKRHPLSTHKLIEMHFIQFVKYFLMLQSRPIADVTQFSRPHPAPHLPVLHWMSISFTMNAVSLQLSLFAWHFGIFQWIRCELQIVKQREAAQTQAYTHTHIWYTCLVENAPFEMWKMPEIADIVEIQTYNWFTVVVAVVFVFANFMNL